MRRTMKPPTDPRRRNALILALMRAIKATFDTSDWKELGYATNTIDYISSHPRLLRSLAWGDDDYVGHVLDAIEVILEHDPANLQILLGFRGLEDWIKENEPSIHAEVYGVTIPAVQTIADVERLADGFDIEEYIQRIRNSLDADPALAVGSTKDLIESVLKTILGLHGANIGDEDMPKLLKRAQVALGIDPKDIEPAAPGAESLRKLLGSMAQIVISVTELRNLYGTGHGKSMAPGLDPASARLVVGVGTSVAAYLMQRYSSMKKR